MSMLSRYNPILLDSPTWNRLRRQLLPEGNWTRAIRDSGLPGKTQSVIETVVRESRLMRFERSEVADELIAHFLDGRERQIDHEMLIEDFGDPQLAASLIQSSKRRNRPMFIRLLKLVIFLAILLTVAYLILMVVFQTGQPQPKINFLAQFNDAVESDPEQRAWDQSYRDLWAKFGLSEGQGMVEVDFDQLFAGNDGRSSGGLLSPTDEDWPRARKFLEEISELLNAARANADLTGLGLEVQVDPWMYSREDFEALFPDRDYDQRDPDFGYGFANQNASELANGSMMGILLPHIQGFRRLAWGLRADSRWAIEQSDPARAVENVRATFGMARQAADTPCLVCGLVGFGVADEGYRQVAEMLGDHASEFSDDELEKLQSSLEKFDPQAMVKFDGERAMLQDTIQRVYTDNGAGDGRITPAGLQFMTSMTSGWSGGTDMTVSGLPVKANIIDLLGPVYLFTAPTRAQTERQASALMDQVETRFDAPLWVDDLTGLESQMANQNANLILKMLGPSFKSVKAATERQIMQRDAAVVAIAMERYYRQRNQWPANYDQLLEGYLAEVPRDRFTGKPLPFKITDLGPEIYSAYVDGDDDGGANVGSGLFVTGDSSIDGDWKLWPPSNR